VTRQQRRRGSELESTILAAAWAELAEVGYARLTMERVAARAHTGKQVLYRRWRGRPDLVVAAIRGHTGSVVDDLPDTGDLRGDVLAVLRRLAARQDNVGSDVIHGLMAEAPDLDPQFLTAMTDVMTRLVTRAVARGEVDQVPRPRVLSVPVTLLRNELLLTREPVAEATLVEIVDEVFLPLVRVAQSRSTGSESTP
jgi:AcrR family transcriptional regulator